MIVKTGRGTDGALHSTTNDPRGGQHIKQLPTISDNETMNRCCCDQGGPHGRGGQPGGRAVGLPAAPRQCRGQEEL